MVVSIKASIIENKKILPDFYQMTLVAPMMAREARPGQFVMVRTSSTLEPLLKRPISLHRINKGKGTLELVYQVVGRGTELLSRFKPDEQVEILGPLGNGFSWQDGFKRVAIVGGGCGIAPLLALAEELVENDREVYVLLGAQSGEKLLKAEEFNRLGCQVQTITDDGSQGRKGFVTQLLKELVNSIKIDQIYSCGPLPMTQGVMKIAQEKDIPCQVSLEERMACGVGACLGCVCQVRNEDGIMGYKRVCHDGPVFDAQELVLG
jgi:dihydroorotate dehydrogenase electron transfer subunit